MMRHLIIEIGYFRCFHFFSLAHASSPLPGIHHSSCACELHEEERARERNGEIKVESNLHAESLVKMLHSHGIIEM